MLSSRYSEDTIRDLDLQYEWYAENAGEDVAERYLAAMEKSRLSLCQQPDLGRICHFRSRRLAKSPVLFLDMLISSSRET